MIRILSYYVMSCNIMLCHVIWYHVMSCLVLSMCNTHMTFKINYFYSLITACPDLCVWLFTCAYYNSHISHVRTHSLQVERTLTLIRELWTKIILTSLSAHQVSHRSCHTHMSILHMFVLRCTHSCICIQTNMPCTQSQLHICPNMLLFILYWRHYPILPYLLLINISI